jgi:hypothetical protein
VNYTGAALRNHTPECIGIFSPLSKQPSVNTSIGLPIESNVNVIFAEKYCNQDSNYRKENFKKDLVL